MSGYLEGPLSKWTNVMKGWQYRWFVLDDSSGLLSYYTSRDKMMKGARRGCVRLRGAIIGIDDEDDSTFTITVDQKIFHFQARHAEERKQWASALEDTILRHSQNRFGAGGVVIPSLHEFDRRLTEADTYLQLLLENVKEVENKINASENDCEKENLQNILSTANEMTDAVKKSILLLQRAKTAVTKDKGQSHAPVSNQLNGVDSEANKLAEVQINDEVVGKDVIDSNISKSSDLENVPSANVHVKSTDSPSSSRVTTKMPVKKPSVTLVDVPPVSYSSSEDDDDDFFDADDTSPMSARKPVEGADDISSEDMTSLKSVELPQSSETPVPNETGFYMDEVDDDNGAKGESVEEHKSVIMHLLSQVKLGMDLTKVVLPTFILERRSLLEMYADFFSHPDLFVDIARKPSPKERMVACMKFYMYTFSAGRNSSIAKKPYNPILGETFQCLYDVPLVNTATSSDRTDADGPVPWAKTDQLAFIAEQVSHHPPISAFYALHRDANIQFNGHIWTKSKFLGLSIGVHNIGQGCIRLLDLDEEYVVTFPNGYGRSILTVPWVELGGDCTITCEKTGYNAFIKFHCKPFYGGKLHRVTGEIFEPGAKKPFFTMDGEWNDKITSHWTTGKNECFIDTKAKKKTKKLVRNLESQRPTESRSLWKDVTTNLKNNDIDAATAAKHKNENQQRLDAKNRLESGVTYQPNLFHEDDCQNWIYNKLLSQSHP